MHFISENGLLNLNIHIPKNSIYTYIRKYRAIGSDLSLFFTYHEGQKSQRNHRSQFNRSLGKEVPLFLDTFYS